MEWRPLQEQEEAEYSVRLMKTLATCHWQKGEGNVKEAQGWRDECVQEALLNRTRLIVGTQQQGSSQMVMVAREDHIHPSDDLFAAAAC